MEQIDRALRGGRARWLGRLFQPRAWMSIALATALSLSPAGLDAQTRPSDYEVMAAYLFNFGRFTTWPAAAAESDETFEVCVVGHDPFGRTLDATLAGETIDGRKVSARRLSAVDNPEGCRILFVSATETQEWPQIMKAIDGMGVLTVSDMPDFIDAGGMIQFVIREHRIRFEVNLTAVARANVRLSSELLKVAASVRRLPGTGH